MEYKFVLFSSLLLNIKSYSLKTNSTHDKIKKKKMKKNMKMKWMIIRSVNYVVINGLKCINDAFM